MFNGILKSDDVEVYEIGSLPLYLALSENCKSNLVFNSINHNAYINLPSTSHIGKILSFTAFIGTNGAGMANGSYSVIIQHSNTTLFTLRQGTVSFMYVGQQLNGLTATDKAKSGWIILGGVQGDTAITGYAGSVAIGSGAYCSNTGGIAIGQSGIASLDAVSVGNGANASQSSVAIGSSANSSATSFCVSLGKSTTTLAAFGMALGYQTYSISSKISLKSNAQFSVAGDAQAGKFILMRQTTDATPTVMTATNAAASATNILSLPNNGTYAFKGIVVAKDATTLDSAMWEVTALMRRGANASTTALVGTPTVTKVFNDAGAAAWTIALTADTTNGGGAITVTGEAGKTIRFVCNVDSAEVI